MGSLAGNTLLEILLAAVITAHLFLVLFKREITNDQEASDVRDSLFEPKRDQKLGALPKRRNTSEKRNRPPQRRNTKGMNMRGKYAPGERTKEGDLAPPKGKILYPTKELEAKRAWERRKRRRKGYCRGKTRGFIAEGNQRLFTFDLGRMI